MHGKGNFDWPDGRNYNGNYVNGLKQGFGKFIWSNGSSFLGYWL